MKNAHRLDPATVGLIASIDTALFIALLVECTFFQCGRLSGIAMFLYSAVMIGTLGLVAMVPGALIGLITSRWSIGRSSRLWTAITLALLAALVAVYGLQTPGNVTPHLDACRLEL